MNEERVLNLYNDLKSEYDVGSLDEFKSYLSNQNNRERLYDSVISSRYDVSSLNEFEDAYGLSQLQEQEEVTTEMMETGQRDAAPAYAMTEEKYAAEKKSSTESPSQDGVSVNTVEVPPQEEKVEGVDFITDASGKQYELVEDDSAEVAKLFKSTGYRSLESVLRVPQYIAEQVYTMTASDEDKERIAKLPQEQRDLIISSIYNSGITSTLGLDQSAILKLNEYSESMNANAESIEKTLREYDQSVYEDITDGNLGRASGRIANQAMGSIPSMIQAMIPAVGIGSIVLGSAAMKSKELQAEGDVLDWKTSANSAINGAAEGLLELVTKKIGSKFFKSIAGKSKDIAIKNIKEFAKEFAKDFGAEGLSESATLAIQKLSDMLLNEDEDAFVNSFGEFVETFLIGGVATGPLSAGGAGVTKLRQVAGKRDMDRKLADTKYDNIVDVFSDDAAVANMDEDVVKSTDIAMAKPFLDATVKSKVANGEITQERGDEIINNYNTVIDAKRDVEGTDVPEGRVRDAMRLVTEKKKLQKEIEGKDEALTSQKRERIQEINTELESIAKGDKLKEEQDAIQEQETRDLDEDQQAEDLQEVNEEVRSKEEVSDYISELDTKTRTDFSIGETLQKVNNAEEINENEIDSAIDAIFKEIDRVEQSEDISETAKQNIISSLYETAEQLDGYEFTTETRTKKVTKSKTVENLGATAQRVSVESFFDGAAGTINGEENVRFTTKDGVVKAERQDGTEFILDTPSMTIEEGDISFDTDGNLEAVTVTDNQGNKVSFTGETAMDLAIKHRMNEIGTVPDAALQQIITEEVEVREEVMKDQAPSRKDPKYVEQTADRLVEEDVDALKEELSGEFGILTAENPMAKTFSEQENKRLNEKGEKWLRDKGYKPRPVTGKYGQAENSFFVPNLTIDDAIAFAKEFNQGSVAHSDGLIYQDGSMNKRAKSDDNFSFEEFSPESDLVSVVKTKDGLKTFGIGYDFSETTPSKKEDGSDDQSEVDAFNDLIDGKTRLKKGGDDVSPSDYVDVEAVAEEMNNLDPRFVAYETPTLTDEDIEVDPINNASDPTPISQEVLDAYGIESADELLKRIEDFDGIPMVRGGMTDMLAAGEIKDSSGKPMKVDGGIMFSIKNAKNKFLAWAGIEESGAESMYNDAVSLYEKNKDLFDRLWREGRLPNGLVPIAINRMADTAVNSNEAVFRFLSPKIKSMPQKNRERAFKLAVKRLRGKKAGGIGAEAKRGLDELLSRYNPTTLDGLFDAISKDANDRAVDENSAALSLADRAKISGSLLSVAASNSSDHSKALLKGIKDVDNSFLTFNNVYNGIGEKSMLNVPKGHVVAIAGIDVLNGGVSKADHDNYGYGPKGRLIALIQNPKHQAQIFPEVEARVATQYKEKKGGEIATGEEALGWATFTFYNQLFQQGQKPIVNKSNIEGIIGLMRLAMPSVQAYTTKEEFDAILERDDVRAKVVDGTPILGLTVDGNIYINPDVKTLNTAIHEFGHIWTDMLRSTNDGRRLLEKGLSLVESDKKAFERAKKEYAEYDSDGNITNLELVREEALVSMIAAKGEGIVNAAEKSKFKSWIKAVVEYVKKTMKGTSGYIVDAKGNKKKVSFINNEVIDGLTVDQFLDMAIADLFSGEMLKSQPKSIDSARARLSKGKPIRAKIDFKSRSGRSFSTSNQFNDQSHLDNYIKFMERKGYKLVGTSRIEDGKLSPFGSKRYLFRNKAVVKTGTPMQGGVTLERGVFNPTMLDGKEFVTMASIDKVDGGRSEMGLISQAVELAVREGFEGVVIPKGIYSADAIDTSLYDVSRSNGDFVVKKKAVRFSKSSKQNIESLVELGRSNGFSESAIKEALLKRGFLEKDIDVAMGVSKKDIARSVKQLQNQISRMKDNNEARQLVAKELRNILKESGLSNFSKRTINKVITNLKNANVSNMQKMLDGVSDAVSMDRMRFERIRRFKKRGVAIKNIRKIGALKELQDPLISVFKINPDHLSDKVKGMYDNILSDLYNANRKYSDRNTREDLRSMIDMVISSYSQDIQRANDIAERINPVLDGDKSIKANLDEMLKADIINKSEHELLTRMPEVLDDTGVEGELDGFTEDEIAEYKDLLEKEKRDRIEADFKEAMSNLPKSIDGLNTDEFDAFKFAKTISVKDIDALDLSSARRLVRGLEMLDAGFVSNELLQGEIKVRAKRDSESVPVNEMKEAGFIDKNISRVKTLIKNATNSKRKAKLSIEDRMMSTPLRNLDQVIRAEAKKFKSTNIYRSLFNPTASAFSSTESKLKESKARLEEANNLLSKDQNQRFKQKVKIALYQIQREYDSNVGNKEVNPAINWVESTLKDDDSIYDDSEKKAIEDMANKYVVDGQISAEKIEADLTPKEKKAVELIDDNYAEMQQMAEMDAATQGLPFIRRENYVHLPKVTNADNQITTDFEDLASAFNNPSLKSKALIQRTGNTHAISFDPIETAYAASRKAITSYYMYPTVKRAKIAFQDLKKRAEGKEQKQIIQALEHVYDSIVRSQYQAISTNKSGIDKIVDFFARSGYLAQLAGPVKAASELTVNASHAVISTPFKFISGIKTLASSKVGRETMDAAIKNTPSTQKTRLSGDADLESKDVESRMLSQADLFSPEELSSDIMSKVKTVKDAASKLPKALIKFNENLISQPDTIIARPLFVGAFNQKFMEITGQSPSWDKIANDLDYRQKFDYAINEATYSGDQAVIDNAASNNPFEGIPDNIRDKNASATKQAMQMVNRYMTRFRTFEYYSAVKAVQGLIGNGDITRMQGFGLLVATVLRMSAYKLLMDAAFGMIYEAMGIDDEEEEGIDKEINRNILGAIATLAMGRNFGNIAQMPINFGVEWLNKEYGEGITREIDDEKNKYNRYKNSVVFSKIPADPEPTDDIVLDAILSSLGSFTPFVKTAVRAGTLYGRTQTSKTQETIDKNMDELLTRIPFEVVGNMGVIPAYKDLRKIYMKHMVDSYKEDERGARRERPKRKRRERPKRDR